MYRIITYNVHSGVGTDKKQDYQRIGRFLASSGADIVLLQEMDTRSPLRSVQQDVSDVTYHGEFTLVPSPTITTDHGWYGNAILTKLSVSSFETIEISQEGREPRNAQVVTLRHNDKYITVINAHLGLKKWERRAQISRIQVYLANKLSAMSVPVILAGDFNEWQFFSGAFKKINTLLTKVSTGRTFPSTFSFFSLDRVWVSKNLQIKQVIKHKSKPISLMSDHLPIQVTIDVKQK
ncbi:endonuclease [Alteromonas sp. KUL42]|uniref:endonuclease/exonuclease/phosphatase family protein n=1 Tax=Alteromonas sp. KUL42 TaxID=2480797 RepID=UPI0010FFAE9F|nr:endonuclease/exonuclease/phosphatase family protein [Alteromonas sp. KUL42]GEA05816.1 endonuclease [Alteromonas sp. KUL42]